LYKQEAVTGQPFRTVFLGDPMDFATDHLIPLVDVGLGNSAYLADLGDA
jgi:hypothetical protein